MTRTPVCLLAAGFGRRAGGPKAWALLDGKPLLERQLEFLLGVAEPSQTAVSIQPDWLERCRRLSPSAVWTPVDPAEPALEALQRLLRAAPPRDWVFVYHVDMPIWEAGLFESLRARASRSPRADAVAPERRGRRGHPVLLSKDACEAVLRLDPACDRLDAYLRTARVETVSVPFESIHENWNSGVPA